MIPQELIERARKIGISRETLERIEYVGHIPKHYIEIKEKEAKKIPLNLSEDKYLTSLSRIIDDGFKTTLIGNGFEISCPKIVGTNLADHLVSNKIEVYEIRFPFNKFHALIYGKLNPEIDIEEVVNTYCKEHGY